MSAEQSSQSSIRPSKTLWLLSLILIPLIVLAFFWPKQGLYVLGMHLALPDPVVFVYGDSVVFADLQAQREKEVRDSIKLSQLLGLNDSLLAFRDLCANHPAKIWIPPGDSGLFFPLFRKLESLERGDSNAAAVRLMHYGDSQIEGDRITKEIREVFQQRFGGLGPGLLPFQQPIPSSTVSQTIHGKANRFLLWGNAANSRADHRRYGPMLSFSQIDSLELSWKGGKGFDAKPKASQFNRVGVLVGKRDSSASIRLFSSAGGGPRILEAGTGSKFVEWNLNDSVQHVEIHFAQAQGMEIQGITLESSSGVVVDNLGMRGCSGTIFSQADRESMKQAMAWLKPDAFLLAFGGNVMPYLNHKNDIDGYVKQLIVQIHYLKQVAPKVPILFIGPSDMSTLSSGKRVSYPLLGDLRNAIRDSMLHHGVAFFDQIEAMGGLNSMPSWVQANPPLAAVDYVHFTTLGAQKMGQLFSESLLREFTKFKLESQFILEKKNSFETFSKH